MFIRRNLSLRHLSAWLLKHVLWLIAFNAIIAIIYAHEIIHISVPWLPVSVIGTAVAFFVGFKNNQAYDRLWEARKIWGGIVNDSRTWGMMVTSFIRPMGNGSSEMVSSIQKRLIYRHIAWLYAHRRQLLEPMSWEQVGENNREGKRAKGFDQKFGLGVQTSDVFIDDLDQYLDKEELDRMKTYKNMATQLVNIQSQELVALYEQGYFNDFRHMQMEAVLRTFYELQGRNERIKKFPFPRDYSSISKLMVLGFIILVPFSLTPELMKLGHWAFWLSIPIGTLIGLVYIIMEEIGDYNENPYMGTPNSLPMLSLCRTIENDLREMLGEKNVPPAVEAIGGVLM